MFLRSRAFVFRRSIIVIVRWHGVLVGNSMVELFSGCGLRFFHVPIVRVSFLLNVGYHL